MGNKNTFTSDMFSNIIYVPSDQNIINNLLVNDVQLFDNTKIVARWPEEVEVWNNSLKNTFLALKIFTASADDKKSRDAFRSNIMKSYGYFLPMGCDFNEVDFIEIGTSDFEFEADPNLKGIYVEPISEYIEKLPNDKNKLKIKAAITHDKVKSECEIYYVPSNVILENNLPEWLKGCNCIDGYHAQHDTIKHLVKKDIVPLLNVCEFLENYNIKN